jgi:hypothetical protein
MRLARDSDMKTCSVCGSAWVGKYAVEYEDGFRQCELCYFAECAQEAESLAASESGAARESYLDAAFHVAYPDE